MSFAVFQQLTQSTVIDACLFASFTSPQATNLVLSRGDRLEVYDVQRKQGKLSLAFTVSLFGRPEALGAFRPREDGPDHLAVVLRRARYLAVLRHCPELGSARTCGQHLLLAPEDPAAASGPSGFKAQLAVDPLRRCLAVRTLRDRVMVFPVAADGNWRQDVGPAISRHGGLAFHEDPEHSPGLGAPFTLGARSPLRLHHIEDFAFLHGYHQPTAVVLGQVKPAYGGILNEDNLCNSCVLVLVLDMTDRSPHLIWAAHHLPHDIFRVVPLLLPVGGMLALSGNAVIYMKEHGASFCQSLNPCSALGGELERLKGTSVKDESKLEILLAGCEVAALSPTALLFSVRPAGRIYLAHLVLESREVVADIVWTSPATASPASGLCVLGEELAFLPLVGGGSTMLKLQPSKKKLPRELQRNQPTKRARTAEPGQAEPEKKEEGEVEAAKSEQLLALLEIHKSLMDADRFIRSYTLAVADEMPSLGHITCLAQWCRDRGEEGEEEEAAPLSGTERLLCCSGLGQKGMLYVCQRAVPLETLTEFDLPESTQFSAVWTFRQPPEEPVIAEAAPAAEADAVCAAAVAAAAAAAAAASSTAKHRFVLASGNFKSMVLETTEEIEEISKSTPLDMDATTLCAGSVLRERLVVQVTPHRLCFMWARAPKSDSALPAFVFSPAGATAEVPTVLACGGSVCDPYVAVRFHDLSLRLFSLCGEGGVSELTDRLPEGAGGPAVCASLFWDRTAGRALLTVLAPAARGTLRVVDLRAMAEVFRTEHLLDVPPVLRNHRGGDAHCALDHLRAMPDPCAPLPRATIDLHLAARAGEASEQRTGVPEPAAAAQAAVAAAAAAAATSVALCAELVEVDAEDCGPSLVVLLVGRPALVYRAFLPRPAGEGPAEGAFPYHFALAEHGFLGLVRAHADGPHRAVVPMRGPGAPAAGAAVLPPHGGVPALWLAARRNQLFVHPLPGTQLSCIAPLAAPCCGSGFFALSRPPGGAGAVAAQVLAPATAGGLGEGEGDFELRGPLPLARKSLQRTPLVLATHPETGAIALAVSESVLESPEPAGPNADEDPLSEDWSIVRVPPVEVEPPPMPRMKPRFELWIDKAKDLAKLGQFRFTFDTDEHVLCMSWVSLPGFPSPSLAVGTGVNTGEDLTCRGRILIFSTKDRDPGILPAVYQRSLKWPVTVVGQWGEYFAHSEGFKLFFERWENSNFNKVAFFDGSMCITSMSSIKNFLLLGDLRKGLDFVQWKEEADSQTRNLRRLSRSPPSAFMTVLACDFVVCGTSLGLVALDHVGTAHLYKYSAHSDGREGDQLLCSCATFSMGFPCRAVLRLQTEPGVQCLFMASGGGELLCLKPIDEQVYRTVTTLLGMLATRLPFRGGLNPRAFRHHDGPPALVAPRKNIEDAVLLRLFAFLSAPLQASIAEKMRLPVASLMQTAATCATCQLSTLEPLPMPAAGAAAAR